MSITRLARLSGVALAGALALAACGSDNNTEAGAGGSSSSSSAASGTASCGTGSLNAEGSSAQKNAIEEAISSFGDTCSGATVNYNPTGSGAGIQQFTAGQVDFAGSDSALNPDKGEVDAAAKRCQGNPAWNLPMVAGPIAEKLGLRSAEEAFAKEIVLQGVLAIQAGNNPRVVEMQLLSFLSNKQQAAMPKAA